MFIVYAQKCGSKQIHNLAPFSTSLPTSAEECQKFKISPPHFEIENDQIGFSWDFSQIKQEKYEERNI